MNNKKIIGLFLLLFFQAHCMFVQKTDEQIAVLAKDSALLRQELGKGLSITCRGPEKILIHELVIKGKGKEFLPIFFNDPEADVNQEYRSRGGYTLLGLAAQYGSIEEVKMLLARPRIDPNIPLILNKRTALHIAVHNKRIENVKVLLNDERVDRNKQDIHGWTALHLAAYRCTDFDLETRDTFAQILRILLDDNRIDRDAKDKNGSTALNLACDGRAPVAVLEMLFFK